MLRGACRSGDTAERRGMFRWCGEEYVVQGTQKKKEGRPVGVQVDYWQIGRAKNHFKTVKL